MRVQDISGKDVRNMKARMLPHENEVQTTRPGQVRGQHGQGGPGLSREGQNIGDKKTKKLEKARMRGGAGGVGVSRGVQGVPGRGGGSRALGEKTVKNSCATTSRILSRTGDWLSPEVTPVMCCFVVATGRDCTQECCRDIPT